MFKLSRKALPVVALILAMLLGAWSLPQQYGGGSGSGGSGSGGKGQGQGQATKISQPSNSGSSNSGSNQSMSSAPSSVKAEDMITDKGNIKLQTSLGKVNGLQDRIDKIYAFSQDTSSVTAASLTEYEKSYIEDSLTSNSAELWSMLYTLPRVHNSVVRDVLRVMIAQHTKDLSDTIQLAKQVGIDTSVDFTKASVYPETPTYDLGVTTQDMKSDYLDFLTMKPNTSYDDIVLTILSSEHTDDVQSELAAERLVTSEVFKAMTKHDADVTQLHLQMLDILEKVFSLKFNRAPVPDFSQDYMSPFIITINGVSNATAPSVTATPSATESVTPVASETATATESATPSASETAAPTESATPGAGVSGSAGASGSFSGSVTP